MGCGLFMVVVVVNNPLVLALVLGFRILGFMKFGGLGVGFGWVLEPKSSVPVRVGSFLRSLSCCLNMLFIICCILFTFFPVCCC